MSNGTTSANVANYDYQISYLFLGNSSREETDIAEVVEWFFSDLASKLPQKHLFFGGLTQQLFDIDLSSVQPVFEPAANTSLAEAIYEVIIPEEILEHDVIVRMSPKRKYTLEVEVKNIKKAALKVVEPERI